MNGDLLFKGKIQRINGGLDNYNEAEIIYRLIKLDTSFFAEEISTDSIFPVYTFVKKNDFNSRSERFSGFSLLLNGKYFVLPITCDDKFKYYLSKDKLEKPSVEEVNTYLNKYKNNIIWQLQMEKMETANEYVVDWKFLKKSLKELCNVLDVDNVLDEDFNETEPIYTKYTSSIDLTEIKDLGYDLSSQDKLCNLVGREKEKKKITKSIAISGNSVLLVGPSGSGKTAIIESLALDIKEGKNEWLEGKIIFYLSTANLQADTEYRGKFEEKLLKLIDFCKKNKGRIILFIDEMHTLYGLGRTKDSSIDAMNILKPYISNGTLTVIGATTEMEYKEYMEKDPAFLRRIEKIDLSLLDIDMNIQVLLSYIKDLEKKYQITLDFDESKQYEIAKYIVEITDPKNQRVVGDIKINNPTISKRVLEEAFTEAIYNKKDKVTIEEVCYAILSCDKLLPSTRERAAYDIKKKLGEIKQYQKILEFPNSNFTRMKTK